MRKTKYRIARFASLLCVVAMAVSAIAFAPKAAWAADSAPAVTYTVKIDGRVYSTDYVSGKHIDIAKDTKIAEIMKAHSVSVNKVHKISAPSNSKLVKLFYNGNEFALSGAGKSTVNVQCTALGDQPLTFADIVIEAKQNSRKAASAGASFKAQDDPANPSGQTHTIKYDANGGEGTMEDQVVNDGEKATLTENAFKKANYVFDSWQGSDGKNYTDKQADVEITSDLTLAAQWKDADKYTVTFDFNDGTGKTDSYQVVKDGINDYGVPVVSGRAGYDFKGWNTEKDGSGKYIIEVNNSDIDSDVTFYAHWELVTYKVKFDANGGEGTMADEDFTYDEEKALTKNAYTLKGHTFKEWSTDAEGKGTVYTDEQKVKNLTDTEGGEVTLFAQWEANDVAVTFDGNGADSGSMDKQTSKYDEEITLNENKFSRTGYTFTGWNTKADGKGTPVSDKAKVKVKSDTTLYAQWEQDAPVVVKVSVTFDANGGSGTMATQSIDKGVATTLNANKFTRDGYTFTGWNTKADGSGTSYANKASYSADTDTILYAQWKQNKVKLTFVANGGTGKMDVIEVEPGTEVTLPACTMTRSGYTFKGWNTAANGQGTSVADKATVKLTKDTRLYAQWQKNTTTANTGSNTDAYKQGNLAKTNDPTPVNTIIIVAVIGAALAGAGYYFNKKRG